MLILRTMHMSLGQPGDFSDLAEFDKSFFFSGVNSVTRLETGLVCLIILLQQIQNRPDLV
jgi:hypothetical protein